LNGLWNSSDLYARPIVQAGTRSAQRLVFWKFDQSRQADSGLITLEQ
jgi:hypothetical protein